MNTECNESRTSTCGVDVEGTLFKPVFIPWLMMSVRVALSLDDRSVLRYSLSNGMSEEVECCFGGDGREKVILL